jgi:hypothetical protein
MAGATPILGYRAVPMIITLPATGVLSLADDLILRGLMSELVNLQDRLSSGNPQWVHSDLFAARLMEARQWLVDHNVPQFAHVVVYCPQESLAALAGPDPSHRGPSGPAISMRSSMPRMRAGLLDEVQMTPPPPPPANRPPAMYNCVPEGPRVPGVTPFYPVFPGMFPNVPRLPIVPLPAAAAPPVPPASAPPMLPPAAPNVMLQALQVPPPVAPTPDVALPMFPGLVPAPAPVLPALPPLPVQPLNLSVWPPM